MMAASASHSGIDGKRLQHLDHALHDHVHPAAIVARKPADDDAERKADHDAKQADGERNARAADDPREHVTSEPVGTQEEHLPALCRTEQMPVHLHQAPPVIGIALAEKAELLRLAGVVAILPLQRLHVELVVLGVHERTDEFAFMEQPQLLRRRIDEVDIAGLDVVGRQELADEDRGVQDGKKHP